MSLISRRAARLGAGRSTPAPPPPPDPPAVVEPSPPLQVSMVDRLDALAAAVRARPDPDAEVALARLRHLAYPELRDAARDVATWPPVHPDHFAGQRGQRGQRGGDGVAVPSAADGVPTTTPDQLDAATLGSAIVHHGCLVVRGLLPPEALERARAAVEQAYAARDALEEPETTSAPPWYVPFVPEPGYKSLAFARPWVREGSGLWTADSPRAMARVVEVLEDVGVRSVVTDHLGTRPVVALKKWTLRKVLPHQTVADWHQDGAFLGTGIRVVNLWLGLSDCGTDAPGLEVVPRRLHEVLPTGTHDANFGWSVAPTVVAEVSREAPVRTLDLRAGDAVLFDELFLHRTAFGPHLTRSRLAIETWFFAPGDYPEGDVPLVF